ncbi:hypothetical protein MBLNU13_g10334t2 [Cladosporium sp. NU13]
MDSSQRDDTPTAGANADDVAGESFDRQTSRRCKKRKTRCGGERPTCRRCARSNEPCHYPQYTAHAEERLKQAEARIKELEAALAARTSVSNVSPSTTYDHTVSTSLPREEPTLSAVGPVDQDISPHFGLDETGQLTYHGSTSRFHASSIADSQPDSSADLRASLYNSHKPALESNVELLRRVWQPLLQIQTEAELGLPPSLCHTLLDIYWTWQHPLHNCVYKPCFLMDMALGGPYYSKFLLHAICALAARHLSAENPEFEHLARGENFLASARNLLAKALADAKPQIPTIQGLLILGGRQCAVGQSSEGWLFTGMAIRMMTDLGLHLDLHRLAELGGFTAADLELRKRLYCSAYIWDKTLSLSLGRPPSLTRLSPTAIDLFDHEDNLETWQPSEFQQYPIIFTHNTMCFQSFCRLGQIVEMVILNNFDTAGSISATARLGYLEQRLQEWHDKLPGDLKMTQYGSTCPPPHIFTLNLLYETLNLILWRPYQRILDDAELADRARRKCVSTANTIHDMFMLYSKTFNLSRMTYLISYCVYSAATVNVDQMRSPDLQDREAAAARLGVSLKILEREARQTPGVRRSIDIIRRQLRTWTPAPGAMRNDSGSYQHNTNTINTIGNEAVVPPAMPLSTNSGNPHNIQNMQKRPDGEGVDLRNTGAGFLPEVPSWSFEEVLGAYDLDFAAQWAPLQGFV